MAQWRIEPTSKQSKKDPALLPLFITVTNLSSHREIQAVKTGKKRLLNNSGPKRASVHYKEFPSEDTDPPYKQPEYNPQAQELHLPKPPSLE